MSKVENNGSVLVLSPLWRVGKGNEVFQKEDVRAGKYIVSITFDSHKERQKSKGV